MEREFDKAVEALRDAADKLYPGAELYIGITLDLGSKQDISLAEVDRLKEHLDKNGLKGL